MKFHFFLLVFFFPGSYIFSQHQLDWNIALQQDWTGIRHAGLYTCAPSVQVRKGAFQASLGPTFLLYRKLSSSDGQLPKLTGARLGLSYFPFECAKKLDFFLQSTLKYQYIVDKWNGNTWNPVTQTFQDIPFINTEQLLEVTVGYGIKVNVGEKWAIIQDIGIGGKTQILAKG